MALYKALHELQIFQAVRRGEMVSWPMVAEIEISTAQKWLRFVKFYKKL